MASGQQKKDQTESTVEFYLEAFFNYICSCIDWRDLIYYKYFGIEYRAQVRKIGNKDGNKDEAVRHMFNTIVERKEWKNRFKCLLELMEETGNAKVLTILRGETIPSYSEEQCQNLVQGHFLKDICDYLDVMPILPYLISRDIISNNQKEHIQTMLTNEGRWGGAMELVFNLHRRSVYWYEGFIWALVKTNQIELAKRLDETLAEKYLKYGDNACIDYKSKDSASMSSVASGEYLKDEDNTFIEYEITESVSVSPVHRGEHLKDGDNACIDNENRESSVMSFAASEDFSDFTNDMCVDDSSMIVGEPFKKTVDDTMNETTVHLLREGMKSVGALIYPGGYGTVFRVGSKFVMTALHVVQNIMDLTQPGSTDTSALEESQVYIDFNESCVRPDRKVYHLTRNVLHERILDLAVLEISNPDENLPPALYLEKHNYAITKFANVSLIGYGHQQKMEKVLDANCKVIPPDSPQIKNAVKWLSEKSSKFKQIMLMTLKDAALVDQGYRGYDRPDKFLMHCFLQHGASGAPVVAINGLELVVVGMLTHGLPEFYYKLLETHKRHVNNELLFEVGTRMSSIYLCVQSQDSNLAPDLFCE